MQAKYDERSIDLFASGHKACAGCGPALTIQAILRATGANVFVANATGCMEVISTQYPQSAWKVPWIHSLFENAAAVASETVSEQRVQTCLLQTQQAAWKSFRRNIHNPLGKFHGSTLSLKTQLQSPQGLKSLLKRFIEAKKVK